MCGDSWTKLHGRSKLPCWIASCSWALWAKVWTCTAKMRPAVGQHTWTKSVSTGHDRLWLQRSMLSSMPSSRHGSAEHFRKQVKKNRNRFQVRVLFFFIRIPRRPCIFRAWPTGLEKKLSSSTVRRKPLRAKKAKRGTGKKGKMRQITPPYFQNSGPVVCSIYSH